MSSARQGGMQGFVHNNTRSAHGEKACTAMVHQFPSFRSEAPAGASNGCVRTRQCTPDACLVCQMNVYLPQFQSVHVQGTNVSWCTVLAQIPSIAFCYFEYVQQLSCWVVCSNSSAGRIGICKHCSTKKTPKIVLGFSRVRETNRRKPRDTFVSGSWCGSADRTHTYRHTHMSNYHC